MSTVEEIGGAVMQLPERDLARCRRVVEMTEITRAKEAQATGSGLPAWMEPEQRPSADQRWLA